MLRPIAQTGQDPAAVDIVNRRGHEQGDRAELRRAEQPDGDAESSTHGGDLDFGFFGENLTTYGLLEDQVRIGDRFGIGEAVLEVSQPRTPCFKFAMKVGNAKILKPFISSGRTGFYFRVIQEGTLEAGNAIEKIDGNASAPTVNELIRLYYFDKDDIAGLRRAIDTVALSETWRTDLAKRLESRKDRRDG